MFSPQCTCAKRIKDFFFFIIILFFLNITCYHSLRFSSTQLMLSLTITFMWQTTRGKMSYANLMGLARRKSLFPTTGETSNVTTRQREKKKNPTVTDLHGSAAVFGIVCHCKTRLCQLETWLLARGRASIWVVWCRDWVNVRRNGPALQRSHGLTVYFFFHWHHGLI